MFVVVGLGCDDRTRKKLRLSLSSVSNGATFFHTVLMAVCLIRVCQFNMARISVACIPHPATKSSTRCSGSGPARPTSIRPNTKSGRLQIFLGWDIAATWEHVCQKSLDLTTRLRSTTNENQKSPKSLERLRDGRRQVQSERTPLEPMSHRPECRWHPCNDKRQRIQYCLYCDFSVVIAAPSHPMPGTERRCIQTSSPKRRLHFRT
jgi:hypothetical protein